MGYSLFDERGYLTDWLIAGPVERPYTGVSGSDDEMRRAAPDLANLAAPSDIALGRRSLLDDVWQYVWQGKNSFVEFSRFYFALSVAEVHAAVVLHVAERTRFPVRFWAAGVADLFQNGQHIQRNPSFRNNYPSVTDFELTLEPGDNQFFLRLQVLGLRDTRFLFGLQCLEYDSLPPITLKLPGWDHAGEMIKQAGAWLDGLRMDPDATIVGRGAPPLATEVIDREGAKTWDPGADRHCLQADALRVERGVRIAEIRSSFPGACFTKKLACPAMDEPAPARKQGVAGGSLDYLKQAPDLTPDTLPHLMCRRLLRECRPGDTDLIMAKCDEIDGRPDCADFGLAMLLRLYGWETTTERERERIRATALGFRYWHDESGSDAMCFGSENHSLLFHSCQRIAGLLFPGDVFTNSGRNGAEQAALGLDRCRAWFDMIEPVGFGEYNSGTYMPITLAALMNVYDRCDDASLTRRAGALADRIFRGLARHTFHGVVTSPQGRVYGDVLYPETGGAQAILSFASDQVLYAFHGWMGFLASSEYTPPDNLDELISQTQDLSYCEGPAYITLHKTKAFSLSSVQLPHPHLPPEKTHFLLPEAQGYQQHIAHATLGPGCHVIVNHPGGFFDGTLSRPGYWYGNSSIPWQRQAGNTLYQLFNIGEEHFIEFTHIHWPGDRFDAQLVSDHWLAGARGDGCIAVWCSATLQPHNDLLIEREFRAQGCQTAWVWVCGTLSDYDGGTQAEQLGNFLAACKQQSPRLAQDPLAIVMDETIVLRAE